MTMKGQRKVFRQTLNTQTVDALLAAPIQDTGRSLATELTDARSRLIEVVKKAQEVIDNNPLTPAVAGAAAKAVGRRGEAKILMERDGNVVLEIHPKARTMTVQELLGTPAADKGKGKDKATKLPSLTSLRDEAKKLGISTEKAGRSKKLLMAAIDAVRAASQESGKKHTQQPTQAVAAGA
jgi:hypothetical protein